MKYILTNISPYLIILTLCTEYTLLWKFWSPKGKSQEDIEEAFYCARTNIAADDHRTYHRGGSNKGVIGLFKVIIYIYIYNRL